MVFEAIRESVLQGVNLLHLLPLCCHRQIFRKKQLILRNQFNINLFLEGSVKYINSYKDILFGHWYLKYIFATLFPLFYK